MNKPNGWLTFSIRDLLWSNVVVAFAICWFHEHATSQRLTAEVKRVDSELERHRRQLSAMFDINRVQSQHKLEMERMEHRHKFDLELMETGRTSDKMLRDAINAERMKLVKVAVELKKQLGLMEPPLDPDFERLKTYWEANQIFAKENAELIRKNERLTIELEDYLKNLEAEVAKSTASGKGEQNGVVPVNKD